MLCRRVSSQAFRKSMLKTTIFPAIYKMPQKYELEALVQCLNLSAHSDLRCSDPHMERMVEAFDPATFKGL